MKKGDLVLRSGDVVAGYRKQIVVDGLSFEVRAGEILVLIGPNGSGKSTVIKTISKQLEAIAGVVYLDGSDISGMKESEIATRMAIMMTNRPRGEMMTVWDMVSTGRYPYTGRLGRLSENDIKAVDDAISLVELNDIRDKDYNCLSDGQKQRTLLARAICQEPEILLLDEPTSFLDIHHKTELLDILKSMARDRKIAVVMSLHEIDLAQKCADYVLCIDADKKPYYGLPDEIFDSETITKLYGVRKGSYISEYGSLELNAVLGAPKVFVIGGAGSAIQTYRNLQRMGIAFAAGVIHENDMEYPIARALSAELISEKAFEAISDESIDAAVRVLEQCEYYICTVDSFGTANEANRRLCEIADKMGIKKWQK